MPQDHGKGWTCSHDLTDIGYEYNSCRDCGWIQPGGARRDNGHKGFFPSEKAIEYWDTWQRWPFDADSELKERSPDDIARTATARRNDFIRAAAIQALRELKLPTRRGSDFRPEVAAKAAAAVALRLAAELDQDIED